MLAVRYIELGKRPVWYHLQRMPIRKNEQDMHRGLGINLIMLVIKTRGTMLQLRSRLLPRKCRKLRSPGERLQWLDPVLTL